MSQDLDLSIGRSHNHMTILYYIILTTIVIFSVVTGYAFYTRRDVHCNMYTYYIKLPRYI